jgi:hypothetical protein
MSNNLEGLGKLAVDFSAAMSGTNEGTTFRLLTKPEDAVQLKDIAGAQAHLASVDLFQSFLNGYRTILTPAPAIKTDAKSDAKSETKPETTTEAKP